jgi:hypothetical protein
MFLPAGAYDVSFAATGYDTLVQHVTVTAAAATVLNVQLTQTTVAPPAPLNLRIIQ